MAIKILVTGGTIDKEYDPREQSFQLKKTNVGDMLEIGRYPGEVVVEELMLKDSRDMTDEDRVTVLFACENSNEDKIVITHGTDTMPDTAKLLGQKINDKTIVLTGAMEPASLDKTDALFNLGAAIVGVKSLEKGVYIVMNGRIFPWYNVQKNVDKVVFEEVSVQ